MLNTICDVFNLFSVLTFKVRQYSTRNSNYEKFKFT